MRGTYHIICERGSMMEMEVINDRAVIDEARVQQPGCYFRILRGGDKTVLIWEASSEQELVACRGHTSGVRRVAWAPDGIRLASASYDGTVRVWDASSGQELLARRSPRGGGVAWASDGMRLASADFDGMVSIWDVASGRQLLTFQGNAGGITDVEWAPNGVWLASAGFDNKVCVWYVG